MKILVGISGGIAAYKSPDLVRRLRESGAEVRVAMTPAATSFIGPLALQAVSGHPVSTDLLDSDAESAMGHIELARWADLILIAPATADIIARLAMGMANDLVSTLCLATKAPIAIAPAMNQQMWANEATQKNITELLSRNYTILGPGKGEQACGETGFGRMLEPTQIATACSQFDPSIQQNMQGQKLMITAGPTREAIDPVRYLSNHSSGKMGFEIAEAALRQGAEVTLIAGPVNLQCSPAIKRINVTSAIDMHNAVHDNITSQDIFIGCAAVADYRINNPAEKKIKKKIKENDQQLVLTMIENPDIIATVANLDKKPYCVGFAAETNDLLDYARGKLQRKNLDMICANDVSGTDVGFDCDQNKLTILTSGGEQHELNKANKKIIASGLIDLIALQLEKKAE